MNPPTGIVTFLFTDIEGSTRRWETDAAAMREALAIHDETLRTAVDEHGGWVFKHTGDGMIAAFASPGYAVDAAVAAQRTLNLPVRMGIATGEAEFRGNDYFGVVLNRAARVMGAGHGGQILVADSTAKHVTDVNLIDLGPRRLRDVSTPVTISQVEADGLAVKFPPLKLQDATPGNLRRAVSSFIGRESETAAVVAAVRAHRLVTLTGMGGVGKTRLSLEVAEQSSNEYPDGVWVFELAGVTDPSAVADAVASILGITQQAGKSRAVSIGDALDGRVRLLVFDNCEHVLDAAATLVETILERSGTVKILATSRQGLEVAGEQLLQIPPMEVTDTESAPVRLFVERANAVVPGMTLSTPEEATAVVEICRRLDGVPLAIELAASRMGSMTAEEVRDRLDERFRLLVGSRRAPQRHQTLRHAVQWSYDQLSDAEQSVLQRVSVFATGFDAKAACAVSRSDEYATRDLLDALVRKSLLVAVHSDGHIRFALLETIRLFADEQLSASGERIIARDAHAHHFASLATEIVALWDSPRQREAYEWFAVELPNLRTAFRWVATGGDLDTAVAIVAGTFFPGYGIDNYEPVAWAEELLEPARATNHPRLGFLYAMASQCWLPGRIEDAIRYGDAGWSRIIDGDELPYGCDGLLSTPYTNSGRIEQAIDWCQTSLARGRDTHALTRSFLIFAFMVAGAERAAIAATDGLLEVAEAGGNPYTLTFALFMIGFSFARTDPLRSRQALQTGLALAHDTGNRANESQLAICLSAVEARSADPTAAFEYVTLAIRNLHDSGNTTTVCSPLAILSTVLDRLGHYEPAATISGFAINPFTARAVPELATAIVHLRDVLGDLGYEALAAAGATMSNADVVAYAHDQIEKARAEMSAA